MRNGDWIEYQKSLAKIDTHEHIAPEQYTLHSSTDIFDVLLIPYNCDSLQSVGCTRQEWAFLMDKTQPFAQRYAVLEKYLPAIRFTGFFRAVQKTMRIQFGENEFSLEALTRADKQLKEQLQGPYYADLLRSMNIKTVLCCSGYDCTQMYRDPAVRFIPTVSEILPRNRREVERLEKASGVRVLDLNSCLQALTALFDSYAAAGVTAVKFGSAYRRILRFGPPDAAKAEQQLREVLDYRLMGDSQNNGSLPPCRCYEELTELDDYLTHYMLGLSQKYGFTVIFHVAMHAWNENDPERAHAHYLTNLIQQYSDVKFVLLHTGAPFFEEAVQLARYYPNVYLDLTWFHIISPQLVRQAIIRILELVPINKVFAFGGDYCYLHTLPGHLEMAMENFAAAFAYACEEGICSEEQAKEILQQWYFENPKRVFQIKA